MTKMQYVRLGKSGLKVSKIILGCMSYGTPKWQPWVLDEEESLKHIKAAWDMGINTFDTADVYSAGESEKVLGKAIKQLGIPRHKIVVLSKCFFTVPEDVSINVMGVTDLDAEGYVNQYGSSRKHIFEAVNASLKRLQMDYLDVLQLHRFDYNTPIEETMQALHDVVQAGLVRYVGMSSCHAYQFSIMQNYAIQNKLTPFISMQDLYNPIYRKEEEEMFPTLRHFGVGCIPWSPLARGFLARPADAESAEKTTRGNTDRMIKTMAGGEAIVESNKAINKAIEDIAKSRGVAMAQVTLAYVMNNPDVTAPIIGTTKIDSIKELVESLDIHLTGDEIQAIEKAYTPRATYPANL